MATSHLSGVVRIVRWLEQLLVIMREWLDEVDQVGLDIFGKVDETSFGSRVSWLREAS
ncbi:unnamed protein product [Dovyalis caffra]|uniref:Uncharacterized protein n=1 Tax=Dovyalis caffra TaxID=77055 RepID=A0AAV1RAK1_9ROSI|nr:unnamed protein product [Dovyalis caffra]